MDIKILDSWLREYLDTGATPQKIAEYMSLCGPSIERIEKLEEDKVYNIEVTTNRVDMMSVYGIAREASVILPQFGVKASLKKLNPPKPKTPSKSLPFRIEPNEDLVRRSMGIVLNKIENRETPDWMRKRLEASGIRSLNAIVDITNYVMTEVGHPCHVFDYDLIKNHLIVIRSSKKGEKIVGLDDKTYMLPEGSIVFDDGTGKIIDLPGILGTKNSVVNENTKQILFFIDNGDPTRIRKTSMTTGIRTVAATLNEKGIDPNLAETALFRGVELYQKVCKAKIASKVYDVYHNPPKTHEVRVGKELIDKKIGIDTSATRITTVLKDLGFGVSWKGNMLSVLVPSFRSQDIKIPEDVIEEIARIYGYHNLPSELMTGHLTGRASSPQFAFEEKVKNYLAGWGGVEVYTLSLVPKEYVNPSALKLKNPLGSDSEYLRTGMMSSLVAAAKENLGTAEVFHLFEMANIYLPKKNDLPEERLMLAGIFEGYSFRDAKGVIEALLTKLAIKTEFTAEEVKDFAAGKCVALHVGKEVVGYIGYTESSNHVYYEFEVKKLFALAQKGLKYEPIPKYPAQIEDLTIVFPDKTKIGDVVTDMVSVDPLIKEIRYVGDFKNNYTFNIRYQSDKSSLTDKEVENVRKKILQKVKQKFGGEIKDQF